MNKYAKSEFCKNVINVFVSHDKTVTVEDFGRGVPLDWNEKEQKYNWELVYCELYAGGKYDTNDGGNYEFSVGLNGLGLCSTQYSSEYMRVASYNGKQVSEIDFKKGRPTKEKLRVRDLEKSDKKKNGTVIRWKPDAEVFTDVNIPIEFFESMLYRQSIVNDGIRFVLNLEDEGGKTFTTKEFDLLTFLAENPNHVFTKEEIFREIWDMDSIGDIATVTVHIKKIREKIETDTSKPQYIETIWGVGYRFKL